MIVVGLTGYSGVGKTSIARALKEHFDYEVFSFSDPIYSILGPATNGLSLHSNYGRDQGQRRILQHTGDIIREQLGDTVFVETVRKKIAASPWRYGVITNIRFHIELPLVDHLIRVERDSYGPINDHKSDHILDEFRPGYVVRNPKHSEKFAEESAINIHQFVKEKDTQQLPGIDWFDNWINDWLNFDC